MNYLKALVLCLTRILSIVHGRALVAGIVWKGYDVIKGASYKGIDVPLNLHLPLIISPTQSSARGMLEGHGAPLVIILINSGYH